MVNVATERAARIRKIGDDKYHLTLQDGSRRLDEEMDGPMLMEMLGPETLLNASDEVVGIQQVLANFDNQPIGEVVSLALV